MKNTLFLILFLSFFSCKVDKENTSIDVSTKAEKRRGITKISYYGKNDRLEKTFEYIDLRGKKYLNQGWYFNEKGDTVSKNSNFYKIKVEKNVLEQMQKSKVTLYYKPLFKNSISGFLLSKENLLKDNYCNLNEHEVDTIYFVDNKLEFSMGFKEKGVKNLGGYILEVSKKPTKNNGAYSERRVYLTIPFEVK